MVARYRVCILTDPEKQEQAPKPARSVEHWIWLSKNNVFGVPRLTQYSGDVPVHVPEVFGVTRKSSTTNAIMFVAAV